VGAVYYLVYKTSEGNRITLGAIKKHIGKFIPQLVGQNR
jgi:hypothetical protein